MSATDGGDKINRNGDKSGGFYKTNGPADAVRSKIAALLDDVTVAGGAPAIAEKPAIADKASNTGNPISMESPPTTKADPLLTDKSPAAPNENGAATLDAASPTPLNITPLNITPLNITPPGITSPPSSGVITGGSPWNPALQSATTQHTSGSNTPALNTPAPAPPQKVPSPTADQLRNANGGQSISIKGRTDGVAIEIGKGHWVDLLSELEVRLTEASDFFRGGRVALDLGSRPLLEEEVTQVRDLLQKVGLKLGTVRTKSQRTFQVSLNLGLSTRLEPGGDAESAAAQAASSNREAEQHFVYRGNLRSGQVLQKHEHILVIGDVNPGAEVISAGDIFVWGRLRGIAHAGADGDAQAVITAFELDPVQLQIVDIVGGIPEEPASFTNRLLKKRRVINRPQIVYLNGNQLAIEPWDESRPGGIAAFRR